MVIGIIALEGLILTYNSKYESENQAVLDGILIKIQEKQPLIPHLGKSHSQKQEDNAQKYNLKNKVNNKQDLENIKLEIGNYTIYIKFNSWSGYVFFIYCLFATLVGEIFCSIADIIFGCIFGYNPFSCKDSLEDCLPWKENSENSEESSKEVNTKIKISDLKKLDETILEFSEMHFVLSRNMAGLALVLSVIFYFSNPIGTIISVANLAFLIQIAIHRDSYSIAIVSSVTLLSIIYLIYRIQANRIIIYGNKVKE